MSDDLKKYLKQLEQFQKRMNKLYEPVMTQSKIWTQQINMQLDPLNNAMTGQITAIERSVSPIIETLNNQKAFIDQHIAINNHSFDRIRKMHLNMDNLVNSQLVNINDLIPESFYSSLSDLALELENSNYLSEGNQDLLTEITVIEPSVVQEKKITWAQLIQLILAIWTVIFMHYSDQASTNQREEQISELRIQTDILERQVEVMEKQTKAIIEQTEAIKEQTKVEQERHEQQQLFEEKFNTFIESLEPYITDQITVDDD